MALVQKRNPRRATFLIGVLVVVLVVGMVAIYLLQPKTGDDQPLVGGSRRSTDLPTLTQFGEDLYATEQFKALHDFLSASPLPETPVTLPGQRNPNPFQTR